VARLSDDLGDALKYAFLEMDLASPGKDVTVISTARNSTALEMMMRQDESKTIFDRMVKDYARTVTIPMADLYPFTPKEPNKVLLLCGI
jgi:hypothetical protein